MRRCHVQAHDQVEKIYSYQIEEQVSVSQYILIVHVCVASNVHLCKRVAIFFLLFLISLIRL